MTNCVTWRLAAVAGLLLAAGLAEASVQFTDTVGWLGAGERLLWEGKDPAYLAVGRGYSSREKGRQWSVSALWITAGSGKRLGYDAKGRDPKVQLVGGKDKGSSTRWTFEIVGHLRPRALKPAPDQPRKLQEGDKGITFRAMAAEGPFKGWYLAAKADGKDKYRLTLVRAKKDSTVFKYITTHYSVGP
jgi:hypothetical protein